MKENEAKFLKKALWVVIFLFVLRCILKMPSTPYECFGYAGEVVSVALLIMILYEKMFWRYNPLEKTPKIYGEYTATLEYEADTGFSKKKIRIIISQTLLNITVKIVTDEITSATIVSNFVIENDEYVLYYTYITNPKSRYSMDNPVQYGTCRLTMQDNGLLAGSYWTTRKTKGDIVVEEKMK